LKSAIVLIIGVATAFALMATGAWSVPKLPTPTCKITGSTLTAAKTRETADGTCTYEIISKTDRGRRVVKLVHALGRKWTFTGLTITDKSGNVYSVTATAGSKNTFVIPAGAYKVVASFKLWVAKNAHHRASLVATKTITMVPAGDASFAKVPTVPVVVMPEGANSPTGSGNGPVGSGGTGWACGWEKGSVAIMTSTDVSIPPVDCSGNISCRWVYYPTAHEGEFRCTDHEWAQPDIVLNVTLPGGGGQCRIEAEGVETYHLPAGWGGSFKGTVTLYGDTASNQFPALPISEQGTADGPPLCQAGAGE